MGRPFFYAAYAKQEIRRMQKTAMPQKYYEETAGKVFAFLQCCVIIVFHGKVTFLFYY